MTINKKINSESMNKLFNYILSLESIDECYDFFQGLCTVNELKSFIQRVDVADMLIDGKTYIEICDETKASTATISRVNRSLNEAFNRYTDILLKLKERES